MRRFPFMVLISVVFSCFATEGEEIIKIAVVPKQVYVEKGPSNQYLNFDFLLENLTDNRWRINTIQASVFDEKDKLILRKYVAHQGVSPSIYTIPKIELEGKGSLFIFNPFYFFDAALKLKKLDYEFLFNSITDRRPYKSSVPVHPVYYETKTDLILPLKGRLFVMDGHDFYAHHRRVDLTHPAARELGIKSNRERYALDPCRFAPSGVRRIVSLISLTFCLSVSCASKRAHGHKAIANATAMKTLKRLPFMAFSFPVP